jgi:hypothetical protein
MSGPRSGRISWRRVEVKVDGVTTDGMLRSGADTSKATAFVNFAAGAGKSC